MKVVSFDIFDTLLTRLVAFPVDLFALAGEDLARAGLIAIPPAEFAKARIKAESLARLRHDHREATFDEIHAELASMFNWSPAQAGAARQIELALERKWIRAVPIAQRRLEAIRAEADRVLFISDMYLPREFLVSLLREFDLWREGDELFVSGETKWTKASGRIFSELRAKHRDVKTWRHFGDSAHADVLMPSKHGIDAEHFCECALTRYEEVFRPALETEVPPWRSKVAGAMRFARAAFPGGGEHQRGLWKIGANVAGPILFGFVAWVLEEAARRGVQRLYFISRDGEILLKIARLIIAQWNYSIDARYLYGSRQAWRPAAGDSLDDWHRDWALGFGTPTDLQSIFARLGVSPESFAENLASAGFPTASWKEKLDDATRLRLWEVIGLSTTREAVLAARKTRRHLAREYLIQEGLGDDAPIGIVDVGWLGSMQRCLDKILADAPARRQAPLLGFYFGLLDRPADCADRMFAYWQDQPGFRNLCDTNFTFFERFTMATHGSVRGYHASHGPIAPDLEPDGNRALLAWGAPLFQDSIVRTAETILEVLDRAEFKPGEFFPLTRRCFELFSESPSTEEATVFGQVPIQDQSNEITAPTMVPKLTEWEILRALLDHKRRLPGWWREGTLKLTRSPSLFLFLTARRWRARLLGR